MQQNVFGEGMERYPRLEIYWDRLMENAGLLCRLCGEQGIQVAGVTKGFNSIPSCCEALLAGGCVEIASSRTLQLKTLKERRPEIKTLLIRIPMLSELPDVVRYADASLVSQRRTLICLNEEAKRQGVVHQVILMYDLGDLREGVLTEDELAELAQLTEFDLKSLRLRGVGTNLSCYGSVIPTSENLGRLVRAARRVEDEIGRRLETVSGGATTAIPLLMKGGVPAGINHLRLGECLWAPPPSWNGWEQPGLRRDVFLLKAEIVETNIKPTVPIGERGVAAFGKTVEYPDLGNRKRAIAAVGNQDLGDATKLVPQDKRMWILGSSGDHTLLDIENCERKYEVGDTVTFQMVYQNILYSTMSPAVTKCIIE